MIWVTWRQHRLQFLVGGAVLALILMLLLMSGLGIASTYRNSGIPSCLAVAGRNCEALTNLFTDRYHGIQFTIPLFLILPSLVGVFWGAPLLARELEQGTHRLAWTQSVGRTRWAGTKIAALSLATLAGAAAFAWTLTWWSRPFVTVSNEGRFAPGIFDLRGIVPVAYALFALAVGVAAGALIRRTVPAMAASIAAYAAARIGVEFWLRPHFASPITASFPLLSPDPRAGMGDWVLSSRLVDGAGHVLEASGGLNVSTLASRCPEVMPANGSFPDKEAVTKCLARLGAHVTNVYQPGSRFWLFQGIEAAIFVALALGLVGLSLWIVRRLA